MAKNVNEILLEGASMGTPGTDAIATVSCRVIGYVLSHNDVGTLSLFNATATSGTAVIVARCATNTTSSEYFGPAGIRFASGLAASVTGNGVVFYKLDN